jgi:hypothetical protein
MLARPNCAGGVDECCKNNRSFLLQCLQVAVIQLMLYVAAAQCNSSLLRDLLELCKELQQQASTAADWRPILGDSKEETFLADRAEKRCAFSVLQDYAVFSGAAYLQKLSQLIPGRLLEVATLIFIALSKRLTICIWGRGREYRALEDEFYQRKFGAAPMVQQRGRQQQAWKPLLPQKVGNCSHQCALNEKFPEIQGYMWHTDQF